MIARKQIHAQLDNVKKLLNKSHSMQERKWIQKKVFINFSKQQNMSSWEDWYTCDTTSLRKVASKVLSCYNGSIIKALLVLYPEHPWKIWKFKRVPQGYFQDTATQLEFLNEIGVSLGITKFEDWYKQDWNSDKLSGVVSLARGYYSGSLFNLFSTIYPEFNWRRENFYKKKISQSLKKDIALQRKIMDDVGNKLGVTDWKQWYTMPLASIKEAGGATILTIHGSSIMRTFLTLYPEHPWEVWRFNRTKTANLKETTQLRSFVKHVENVLKLDDPKEWYRVSIKQIQKLGGAQLVTHAGGLEAILRQVYPEYEWDSKTLRDHGKKAEQRWLKVLLQEIFPNEEVIEDYQHPLLQFPVTNEQMELDLWLPKLSLAVEYHGPQHYHQLKFFGPLSKYKQRDQDKRDTCKQSGITLIEIPYHTSADKESLEQIIRNVRPELFDEVKE